MIPLSKKRTRTMRNEITKGLVQLFEYQKAFQKLLGFDKLPVDDPKLMQLHLLGLVGEIGEVLQADQRWKTNGRNTHFDFENKKVEIADCFIYLINVCLFSNILAEEILDTIEKKINKNYMRKIGG